LVKTGQESREFAALFLRGMRSFQDLDAPDKLSFSAFFTRYTRNCEGMFIYYRDGALEKALWDEVERTMNDYFAYRGVKEWWATRKHWLTDEFRTVVEAIIAKNPEPKIIPLTTKMHHKRPNKSMTPTPPPQKPFWVFATIPWRGLSLPR